MSSFLRDLRCTRVDRTADIDSVNLSKKVKNLIIAIYKHELICISHYGKSILFIKIMRKTRIIMNPSAIKNSV